MSFLALLIALALFVMVLSTRSKFHNEMDRLELKIRALESLIRNSGRSGALEPGKEQKEPTPAVSYYEEKRTVTTVPVTGLKETKQQRESLKLKGQPKKPEKPDVSFKEQIEKFIGQNLSIWIGAAALVVAGGYFIKYAYDNNLLSPGVRTGLGYLAALAAIGAAEKFKKTLGRVSEGLASAGVGVGFGVTWSAVNVLELLPPTTGFIVMAVIAAFGVLLSLRFGPVVAVVGMLGGFLTPVLMNTGSENHIALFLYLMALLGGVAILARKTGWYWMLTLASIGINGWALAWIVGLFDTAYAGWFSFFIFASMLIIAGGGYSWDGKALVEKEAAERAGADAFGSASLRKWQTLLALVFTTYATLKVPFTLTQWGWVALLGISLMVLERFEARYKLFGWGGFLIPAIALWSALENTAGPNQYALTVLLGLFGLYTLLGFLLQLKSENPGYWTMLSTAALVYIYFQGDFNYIYGFDLSSTELCASLLAVSLGLFLATWGMQKGKAAEEGLMAALSSYFLAGLLFLNIIILNEVDLDYLAAVFAAEVFALTMIPKPFTGMSLPGIFSRGGNAPSAAGKLLFFVSGLFVLFGLGENVHVNVPQSAQDTWLWPWQFEILAAPALFYYLANRRIDKKYLFYASIALTFLFVTVSIRYLFQEGNVVFSDHTGVFETGMYLVVWGALGLAGIHLALKKNLVFAGTIGQLMLNASLVYAALVPVFFGNPYLTGVAVGETPVLNMLLWLYGPPLALFVVIGRHFSEHVFVKENGLNLLGFILLFLLISLEVRQGFSGSVLITGDGGEAEKYAYSIAWLISGIIIMVGGMGLKSSSLRLAGLIFVSIATAKIFLYDTASLSGLYRVASFAGLGVSSLGIAWLYKKFVKTVEK